MTSTRWHCTGRREGRRNYVVVNTFCTPYAHQYIFTLYAHQYILYALRPPIHFYALRPPMHFVRPTPTNTFCTPYAHQYIFTPYAHQYILLAPRPSIHFVRRTPTNTFCTPYAHHLLSVRSVEWRNSAQTCVICLVCGISPTVLHVSSFTAFVYLPRILSTLESKPVTGKVGERSEKSGIV